MKIKVKFQGIEPIFIIHRKPAPNYESTTYFGLFYPVRRLKFKISLFFEYYKLKRLGIKPERCECCGEGWSIWMIDEPNGKKYSLSCCDNCVNDYDWSFSRKPMYLTGGKNAK